MERDLLPVRGSPKERGENDELAKMNGFDLITDPSKPDPDQCETDSDAPIVIWSLSL